MSDVDGGEADSDHGSSYPYCFEMSKHSSPAKSIELISNYYSLHHAWTIGERRALLPWHAIFGHHGVCAMSWS